MRILIMALAAVLITGCAANSKKITAQYVSPAQYKSFSCEEMGAEVARINTRVGELTGQIDERASGDKAKVAVGVLLFWPVLFFIGDNEQDRSEFSRLKGESQALQEAAAEKGCPMQVQAES